jgi:hypothetical protein
MKENYAEPISPHHTEYTEYTKYSGNTQNASDRYAEYISWQRNYAGGSSQNILHWQRLKVLRSQKGGPNPVIALESKYGLWKVGLERGPRFGHGVRCATKSYTREIDNWLMGFWDIPRCLRAHWGHTLQIGMPLEGPLRPTVRRATKIYTCEMATWANGALRFPSLFEGP